ncbi:hypothetical protein E3N88_24822 [Mikania micrantha]|uniref:Secreted protein n=1 Tax=Mikania micrantha TaxID=192012 RepID=A0A5N6N386_9ASTR|nr:hypothetical protein E3N88_24822 [Mikania micrantha]
MLQLMVALGCCLLVQRSDVAWLMKRKGQEKTQCRSSLLLLRNRFRVSGGDCHFAQEMQVDRSLHVKQPKVLKMIEAVKSDW